MPVGLSVGPPDIARPKCCFIKGNIPLHKLPEGVLEHRQMIHSFFLSYMFKLIPNFLFFILISLHILCNRKINKDIFLISMKTVWENIQKFTLAARKAAKQQKSEVANV